MNWIQTHSGAVFDLLNPRPDMIHIEDIAHALAHICRFTGHVTSFYSVAQHSVLVARALPPHLKLVGLLHDATEAYVSDMAAPLKALIPQYREIEDRVWEAIAARFALPVDQPAEIKQADLALLRAERAAFMGPSPAPWAIDAMDLPPLPALDLSSWSPVDAREQFMAAWTELSAENFSADGVHGRCV